jgi:hypothetical protein
MLPLFDPWREKTMAHQNEPKVELYRAYSVEEIQERREMFSKSDSWSFFYYYSSDY